MEKSRQLERLLGSDGPKDVYEQVEVNRVLLFVFAVLIFVIFLELFLHYLEHKTKRKKKYADMLHKTTQELMIVGLIYLLVKFCTTTGLAAKNGIVYQAMDFADLLILFTVLAMVLQATVILFRLRKYNREMGKLSIQRTEIVLVSAKQAVDAAKSKNFISRYFVWAKCKHQLEQMTLRSIFLRSYDLPQLFPFEKYIEDVQDSQVAHLVEIDITIWIVLMAAYSLFFIFSGELFDDSGFKAKVKIRYDIFAAFAMSLFLLMCGLLAYLRHLVQKLLQHAAQQVDVLGKDWSRQNMRSREALFEAVGNVVQKEAEIPFIFPPQAIEQMRQTADELSEDAHHDHHDRGIAHLFSHDLLCQILGSMCRRVRGKRHHKKGTLVNSIKLPFFSRKFVHFVMQLLFIMNGFYYSLFINCVLYLDGFNVKAVIKALVTCIPLFLNTFVIAPMITRQFTIINGVFRVDAKKLSGIVEHFAEVEATKNEMIQQITHYLQQHSNTVADINSALAAADATDENAGDGFIDMDVVRGVLKQFGFRFQRQKFVTFVRMQFETKGTTIRYADLIKMFDESETLHQSLAATPSNYSLQPIQRQQSNSITVEPQPYRTQSTLSHDTYFV